MIPNSGQRPSPKPDPATQPAKTDKARSYTTPWDTIHLGRIFVADESQRMSGDNPSRQIYRELAAEEREHAALLATELERRRIRKPGLL